MSKLHTGGSVGPSVLEGPAPGDKKNENEDSAADKKGKLPGSDAKTQKGCGGESGPREVWGNKKYLQHCDPG